MVYSTSRFRRRPQNEDDLKIEDNLKNKDNLKNEDNIKNEDDLDEVDLNMKKTYIHTPCPPLLAAFLGHFHPENILKRNSNHMKPISVKGRQTLTPPRKGLSCLLYSILGSS